jgi:hypothetical protein
MSLTYINKPNFFILGAGKSGTTSLYYYLKQHPDIFLTPVKEPTFFSEGFQMVKNPVKYFELFDSVGIETIIGEASHVYLTNPTTAKVLKALFPNSKFLVILRNPADRAYSLYHHMRRRGYEYINTFEKAIEVEEERCVSKIFMETCPQYFYNFLYFRSGLYGEQLKRYFSMFSQEQFHIIKYEQFIADTISSIRNIFLFLGVNPDFVPSLGVHNAGKVTAKFPQIQYFFKTKVTKPAIFKKFSNTVLKRINMIEIPPMRTETRHLLLERYTADLQLLYDITGISFLDSERECGKVQKFD